MYSLILELQEFGLSLYKVHEQSPSLRDTSGALVTRVEERVFVSTCW